MLLQWIVGIFITIVCKSDQDSNMNLLQRIQSLDASRRLEVVNKYIPALLVETDQRFGEADGTNCCNENIVVGHIHFDLVNTLRQKLDADVDHSLKDAFMIPPLQEDGTSQKPRFFGLCAQMPRETAKPTVRTETRNAAFEKFTSMLLDCDVISKTHTDMYPVTDLKHGGEPLATINRNAAPFLGITSVGVHLLCYVCDGNAKGPSLWLAQRAANKSHNALRWDPTVAGGQPASMSLFDNVIKEAGEEAGIDPHIVASNAVATGCLSQMTCKPNGTCMKQSLYYTWDMQVDREGFVPRPADGEVADFRLFSAEELEREVRFGDRLRPAMILVVTDFLFRHGVITPDNEPDYARILAAMHKERLIL